MTTQITVYVKLGQSNVREVRLQIEGDFKWSIDTDGSLQIEANDDQPSGSKTYIFNWAHVLYFDWTDQ